MVVSSTEHAFALKLCFYVTQYSSIVFLCGSCRCSSLISCSMTPNYPPSNKNDNFHSHCTPLTDASCRCILQRQHMPTKPKISKSQIHSYNCRFITTFPRMSESSKANLGRRPHENSNAAAFYNGGDGSSSHKNIYQHRPLKIRLMLSAKQLLPSLNYEKEYE